MLNFSTYKLLNRKCPVGGKIYKKSEIGKNFRSPTSHFQFGLIPSGQYAAIRIPYRTSNPGSLI